MKDVVKKMASLPLMQETEIATIVGVLLKNETPTQEQISKAWKQFQVLGESIGVVLQDLSDAKKIALIKKSVSLRLEQATRASYQK